MRTRFGVCAIVAGATLLAVCGAYARRDAGASRTGSAVDTTDAREAGGDLAAEVAALRRQVEELRAASQNAAALAELDIPASMDLCGLPIPLDRPEVREALAYELILTAGKPTMPLLWMRRAPVMLPAIEAGLKQRGLPDDLKFLPMIESDLRWFPESPAGAVGLWQFMKSTGTRYGLRVDGFIDERMDPERSTDAATAYLAQLSRIYTGDWFLALASYNAGETLVQRAMAEQGSRNYFDLYLPYETRRYVLRMAAAKLVYEHPERYGLFRMKPLWEPKYRHVQVSAGKPGTDLRSFARAQKISYAALRIHNPQLRGPWLPAGTFRLRVPE